MFNKINTQYAEYVDRVIQDQRNYLHGEVVSYDSDSKTAVVRPVVRDRVPDEIERLINQKDMIAIPDVTVSQVCSILYHPSVGDHGILLFHDKDISEYLKTRQTSDAYTARFNDYSDAIFIPCEVAKVDRPDPTITIEDGTVCINASTGLFVNSPTICLNGIDFSTHIHEATGPFAPTTPPVGPPCEKPVLG